MRRFRGTTITAWIIALGMLLIACSGGATDVADDTDLATDDPGLVQDDPGTKRKGGKKGAQTAVEGSTTGATSSPGLPGSTGGTTKGKKTAPYIADLWPPAQDRIGITDDTITLCGHAALIFAEAFDTRPEDLTLYWDRVNENGGVYDRRVEISWEDDAYSPDTAQSAAETCKSKNPFFLIGGIGFDQIPGVREWAERNKMLYIHHIAVDPKGQFDYSFSMQPTVEQSGTAFGEYIVSRYKSKRIGIVYRQSENWEPGRRLGKQVMEKHGVNVVADLPVQQNQGVYSQQIAELQRRQAEVVWLWENALVAGELINQAAGQGYRPKWVVFPFQTTLDLIGGRALGPTIDGVASWPAYVWGGYNGNPFKKFRYNAEIRAFEEASHEAGRPTNDILFQTWLGMKALHDLLLRCGPDCSRNRLAGLMLGGLNVQLDPLCKLNFAASWSQGGHLGMRQFLAQETFPYTDGTPGRAAAWKTTSWCSPSLL